MEADPFPSDDTESSLYTADQSLDDHLMSQEDEIRKAIALSQPLVSSKEPFSSLLSQYADNPRFLFKLQSGLSTYSHLRRVRGDGNCFYRCLLFAILEFAILPPSSLSPLRHYQLISSFYTQFLASPSNMIASGLYSDMIVEEFFEMTKDLVDFATARTLQQAGQTIFDDTELSIRHELLNGLLQRMLDDHTCQWYITWLRCLTSFQLQTHSDDYTPYLVDHSTVKAFCASEVDVPNKEVDALQILALCTEMQVAVRIEYLDGSEGELKGYVVPEGKEALVTVLYRPGHYDIIYKAEDERQSKGSDGVQQGSERKEA